MMKFTALVWLFIVIESVLSGTDNSGPIGELEFYYVKDCDQKPSNPIDQSTELKMIDGKTHFNGYFDLPFELSADAGITYTFNVDEWTNGVWKNAYFTDGDLLEFVNQYCPNVWENLRAEFEPPIEEEDYVPPGVYKLTDFYEEAQSLSFPQILYGKFKMTLELLKDDEPFICKEAEVDSNKIE